MIDQHSALESLRHLLPGTSIVTNPVELITYEIDAGLDRGRPDAVVYPRSAEEVARIVAWAREHHVPIVARGAGTGLSGGAVPEHGGIIVQFGQMNRLIDLDDVGRSVVVEPGMVNLKLDALVRQRGWYYPPDPSSGRSSTIGGNLAENSGGPHCFKYGVTTNYVSGVRLVLGSGAQVRLGGRALDYPEYDLVGLVTGSEGTLGVVTEASLRLVRNPAAVKTMMAAFESVEAAGDAVSAVIAAGLVPATLEMMDRKIMQIVEDSTHAGLPIEAEAALIVEADGSIAGVDRQIEEIAAILREHEARDLRIAQTAEQRDAIWYGRKSAAGAMARLAPAYYLVDVTVPRSTLARTLATINRICDELDLRVGYVFHAGDGNLHPLILIPEPHDPALMARVHRAGREIAELSVAQDGSITGEHGVGIEKRAFMPLMYSADELQAMLDIRQVFDPDGLLNPGKIFPPDLPSPDPLPEPKATLESPFAPASAADAAEAIRAWTAAGQRIRVRGGGTKSAHLLPCDTLLLTSGLRGIRSYARDDLYVTVGAGTRLADLQAELARDRFAVPLVSPWPDATIGGIVATNWNAPLRTRYGGIRDLLLAATIALPNGRVIRAGRPVVKNVAGYDLPKLFVGAHGTLGLIADVTLKLVPLPRVRTTLRAELDDLDRGLRAGLRVLRICREASALLLCRGVQHGAAYTLIYSAEGVDEDVAAEIAEVRAALRTEGIAAIDEAADPDGSAIWARWIAAHQPSVRAGVAAKDAPAIVRELRSDASFVADLLSGMVYVAGLDDLAAIRQRAHQLGGYALALGSMPESIDRWGPPSEAHDLMRAIKRRWDVQLLFNPDAFVL